jgi:magnesium transporter
MVFIRNLVGGLLAELEDNIDHDRFKRLLHYSRRLVSFKNRAKLVSLVLTSNVTYSFVGRWKKP